MYTKEVEAAHRVFAALSAMGEEGLTAAVLSQRSGVDFALCRLMCADLVRQGHLRLDAQQHLHLTPSGGVFFRGSLAQFERLRPQSLR